MATTPKGVPYPAGGDLVVDGDDAIQALAEWVDARPGIATLTTPERDALAGAQLWTGRKIYNTTEGHEEHYDGADWVPSNPTSPTPNHNPASPADAPSTYPAGVTQGTVLVSGGWPVAASGTLLTVNRATTRIQQWLTSSTDGVALYRASTSDGTGWQAWQTISVSDHTHASGGPTVVVKTADESVASSTTMQDDDELVVPIAANETMVFDIDLIASGASSGDLRLTVVWPAGGTGKWVGIGPALTATSDGEARWTGGDTSGTEQSFGMAAAALLSPLKVFGHVVNGATAGEVRLRWAQAGPSGTATVIRAGSKMMARSV